MKKSVIEKMIANKSDGKLTGMDHLTCWIKEMIKEATSIGDIQDYINYSVKELLLAKTALMDLDPDIPVFPDAQYDEIMAQIEELSGDEMTEILEETLKD